MTKLVHNLVLSTLLVSDRLNKIFPVNRFQLYQVGIYQDTPDGIHKTKRRLQ